MARVWFGLPGNKTERRILGLALNQATRSKPIRFYVGSCPDYSHNGQVYTHQGLDDGIPLLTRVHLEADAKLLLQLEARGVPFEYVVMVADVEAIDEFFCERFAGGDEQEFLRRCKSSVVKTADFLAKAGLDGKFKSSSFFGEFGRDKFMDYQGAYQRVLEERLEQDRSFHRRIMGDLMARREMYRHMYPGINDIEFLIKRTLRTMAQYLTLGRLIGEKGNECFPVIIVHPTRNKGVFNERNRFLLPDDGVRPQPTIPIFEMKRKVY